MGSIKKEIALLPRALSRHPQRAKIDMALAEGMSAREVAKRFGVSVEAVEKRKAALASKIALYRKVEEIAEVEDIIEKLDYIWKMSKQNIEKAQGADTDKACRAIDVGLRVVRTEAEITGRMPSGAAAGGQTINVMVLPKAPGVPLASSGVIDVGSGQVRETEKKEEEE